jgi:hypothetical protein
MKLFDLEMEYCGYSRGIMTVRVEAENADKAKERWYEGVTVEKHEMRNDQEHKVMICREVKE